MFREIILFYAFNVFKLKLFICSFDKSKKTQLQLPFTMHTGSKADTANGCCTFGSSAIEFVTSTASYTGTFDASCFGFPATSASTLLVIGLRFK